MKKSLQTAIASATFIAATILFPYGIALSAQPIFNSTQVGSSPANGYVLQTNGFNSIWVATSTLGITGSGGTGGLSTTTPWTVGQLVQVSSNSAVKSIATSTLGIALSDTTGTLSVGQGGTGATSFTAGNRLVVSHGTSAFTDIALPLTVSNGGTGATTLTGLVKGNGASTMTVGVNGTDYSLIAANSCGAGNHLATVTAAGVFTCTADSGSTTIGNAVGGGTAGSILYVSSLGTLDQTNSDLYYSDITSRVGIGTNMPSYKLDVLGTVRAQGNPGDASIWGIAGSGGIGVRGEGNAALTKAVNADQTDSTGWAVYATGAKNYFNGAIGISTTTPAAKLDLYGTAGTGDIFAISSSSNARLLTFTSGGLLGIGSSTPSKALTVSGEGYFTGTSTASCFSMNGGACLTSGGGGGSGTVGTSTLETANYFPRWSTTSGSPALLTGSSSIFQLGSSIGIGTTSPGAFVTIATTSANAFDVGQTGATNPAFQVDTSAATSATGIQIKSTAAGAGTLGINAISSATNEQLNISGKGTGSVSLLVNGAQRIQAANSSDTFTNFFHQFVGNGASASIIPRFSFTGAADTVLTAATEAPDVYFNMGQIRQHASNTTIPLQRDFRITQTTHSFAAAGGVITQAATLSIDGPPIATTTAVITNSAAIYVPTSILNASTTNSFGIQIVAATGATNNYAASTSGRFVANGLTTSASAQTVNICGSTNDGGELIADTVACLVSAARYKENVATSTVGLDELMQLRPVSFTWKKDFNKEFLNDPNKNGVQYSLIADEVMKVDPKLVVLTTSSSTFEGKTYAPGAVQGLADVNHWVSVIVAWLQEIVHRQDAQQAQIDKLQAQLKAQQAEIDTLTHKLKK